MSDGENTTAKSKIATRSRGGIGPAVIVAAVVCGPGSIFSSSKAGAQFGYAAAWVLVLACLLMMVMVTLSTRIGLTFDRSPCGELAARIGRPWAVVIGVAMFLIIACFQSSNNIAVAAGLETFGIQPGKIISIAFLALLNGSIILFLYFRRQVYRMVESIMKVLVLTMVIAFAINCAIARPSFSGLAWGLVPSVPGGDTWVLIALMGTTFSVAAAFYQAYLVREKGWTHADQNKGTLDSIVGITTLGLITLVIMMTAAAVFYDNPDVPELDSAQTVALQLEPLFGIWAQVIFGVGIMAAALSSFMVNAMIGGHIMSDGLGLGDKIDSRGTQHFTAAALLIGMIVALASIGTGIDRTQLIIFAQALTVIGVPALALALLYLGVVKRKENRNAIPLWVLLGGMVGLLVTCLLAVRTTLNIVEKLTQS